MFDMRDYGQGNMNGYPYNFYSELNSVTKQRNTSNFTQILAMNVQETVTNRGGRAVIWDKHIYKYGYKNKTHDITWRCTNARCTARIRTDDSCKLISNYGEHNHDMTERKVERHAIRANAKRKASTDITSRPLKIVRNEIMSGEEENLTRKDIKSLQKSVYRARRKKYATFPNSRAEVHKTLREMNIMTNKDELFLLCNNEELGTVIFSTSQNLQCLTTVKELFMDGTFKYCTRYFYQLYTIHGYCSGNYVPLVFMLLPGKSETTYRESFSMLIRECAEREYVLKPDIIHVDFEVAVINVVQDLFPQTVVKGCRFHLSQAWWRQIQALGLTHEYKEQTDIGKWLHWCFGLPFLDPDQVSESFAYDLMAEIPDDTRCEAFADYLTDTYIDENAKFVSSLWAEIPSDHRRTTNGPEAFHRHFNGQFYVSHPAIFVFVDVLLGIQATTYIQIRNINEPHPTTKAEKDKLRQILQLYEQLCNSEITRFHFVKALGFKFQPKIDL